MKKLKQKLSVTICVSAGIFKILYDTPNAEEVIAVFLTNGNKPVNMEKLSSIIGKDVKKSVRELENQRVLVRKSEGFIVIPCVFDFLSFVNNIAENK